MPRWRRLFPPATAALMAILPVAASPATEVKVMISGGMTAAYKEVVPVFKRKTGLAVSTAYGPSMGTAPNAIPVRLARGDWLSARMAAAGLAAVNTWAHIGTAGETALLGVIKELTGSFAVALLPLVTLTATAAILVVMAGHRRQRAVAEFKTT